MSDDLQAIKDVYEKVSDRVTLEEFRSRIQDKVKEHYGLLSEVGAAKLLAREMGAKFKAPEVSFKIKNLSPGMSSVDIAGRVLRVYGVREFERDDGSGKVANLRIMDETGDVRLVLWGEKTKPVEKKRVKRGDVVQVRSGYTRTGLSGDVEVHIGRRGRLVVNPAISESMPELEETEVKVGDVENGMRDVTIEGVVSSVSSVNTFNRADGREGRVVSVFLRDETGEIRVSLWNEKTEGIRRLRKGSVVRITGAYTKEGFNDAVEIHCSSSSEIEVKEESGGDLPEIESNLTPISKVTDSMRDVDVRGRVERNFGKRSFSRINGEEGKVANLIISDDTGEIRLVLWGEAADMADNLVEGSEVTVENAYTKKGRNDELEIHVGWRGRVVIEVEDFEPLICDLQPGMSNVDLDVRMIEVGLPEEFEDSKLVRTVVGDVTGRTTTVFWNGHVESVKDMEPGATIKLTGVKVNDLGEVHVSSQGQVNNLQEEVPKPPEGSPSRTTIRDLEPAVRSEIRAAAVALTDARTTSSFGEEIPICSCLLDDGSGQVRCTIFGKGSDPLFNDDGPVHDMRSRFRKGLEFLFTGVLLNECLRVGEVEVPDPRKEVVSMVEELSGDN